MNEKKYCLALDLINDAQLMSGYREYHQAVWPEIIDSIQSVEIDQLEIYNVGNRLFMIMTVNDSFLFENKYLMDKSKTKVREWEELTWNFQKALLWAESGEKWMLLEKIFQLPNSN